MMARTPDITLPEVVTYDGLPGSAGGAHSLRVKRPDVAFRRLQTFLESCTEPVSLPSWTFEIYKSGPSEPTAQLSLFATELFGGPRYKAQTHTEWNVPPGSVNEALDALVGCDAVTTHGRSVAALTYSVPVRLIDPNTRAPYPDITPDACGRFAVDGYGRTLGESGIRATLGNAASSLSLWLNLPADERLSSGARHLQDHLPFRLSAKHWRLWRPNRSGDSYRSNKIPSPVHDHV
ncbi:MAG: hypothetical protein U5O16_36030 [Rhodococcus sp. (in: high G+C Gram-positive bacteria)]|uniref:hypothetical protein n=1 Tax=Rhodococcus sp. TaxID=1831 RepID=UPI002ADC3DEA|nr:hypothetical protein [Rhodococcus sp. (in: high G+C Gram-positive bacteria)]